MIDPYGTWRLVDLPGANRDKPAMQTRVRLAKAYDVRRLRPEAIVLGSSRSHVGLRMSHPGWSPEARQRYNLGFDGATTAEMYQYLRHAQAVQKLRQVVLGLDTWQLGPGPATVRPDFDPSLLYGSAAPLAVHAADLRVLLSLDTLRASIHTLVAQGRETNWLAPDGQRLGDVFFHRPGDEFMTIGAGAYFAKVDREEASFKLPDRRARQAAREEGAPERLTSIQYIERIIAFCRDQGIDLRVLVTPAHAHQMEISSEVGEWPAIEAGKRALVALLAADAARHPGARPFPLWDFSGYSSVTTEPVPPPGSFVEMANYWDSSHFTERVGDMVLDRVFGVSRPDSRVPGDFGRLLASDTIDDALAGIRLEREQYRREHPDDVAAIRSMVAALAALRTKQDPDRMLRTARIGE